ncbi:MAG: GspH/FimT family pseudopilin [Gammaproteobacteria bacterium]|nr:GspH/FimT family pseudopilin [Gammaproteobacteria bacterium]
MRGATLIELLTALAVAGVLLAWGGVEATRLLAAFRADAAVAQMLGAVRFARHAAVERRGTVTLCPAAADRCGRRNDWHRGALVFLDRNSDGRRSPDETMLRRLPRLRDGERVYWRSFRNRTSLSMLPTGLTDWQNGNFLYCPPGGDPRYARQLILNAQGRIRQARDSDGDGVREDAAGRALACPAP